MLRERERETACERFFYLIENFFAGEWIIICEKGVIFTKTRGKLLSNVAEAHRAHKVHFGKDSQVYLGPLFVRVTSKITFIRDSVRSVLIAMFVPLKLTFKKKKKHRLTETNERTNVTRFLNEDGRRSREISPVRSAKIRDLSLRWLDLRDPRARKLAE